MATHRRAELKRYWQDARGEFDADLRRLPVRLVLPAANLPDLARHVPGRLTRVAVERAVALSAGQLEVALGMEGVDVTADQLFAVPGVKVR